MFKYSGRLAAILFFFAAAGCSATAAIGSSEEWGTWMILGGVLALVAGGVLLFDGLIETIKNKNLRFRKLWRGK